MNARNTLKITDLDAIANTLQHHARWLLRIRRELLELADESSHEQEAHEVRKRLRAILIPPDEEEEAEALDELCDPLASPITNGIPQCVTSTGKFCKYCQDDIDRGVSQIDVAECGRYVAAHFSLKGELHPSDQAVSDATPDPFQRCLATTPAAFPCGILQCSFKAGHHGPHTFEATSEARPSRYSTNKYGHRINCDCQMCCPSTADEPF